MEHRAFAGLIAGAAGVTALNLVSYADMLLRGRAASSLPGELAGTLADSAGIHLGSTETRKNRTESLGATFGITIGTLIGVGYGACQPALDQLPGWFQAALVGGAAMLASDVSAVTLGKTNPTEWPVSSWIADVVPHLAYGIAVTSVYLAITKTRDRGLKQLLQRLG